MDKDQNINCCILHLEISNLKKHLKKIHVHTDNNYPKQNSASFRAFERTCKE